MLSTIRPPRLPFEILAKIFTLTSPIASNRPLSSTTLGGCHPLVLVHVSQQWRAVALSTPCLWNEINIVDGIPLPETFLAALTFWLSLSTNKPLYLDLVTSKSGIHAIQRCVHLLTAHAHRWKEASFVFMNTDLDDTGLTSLSGVFPRLDKLRISCGLAAFGAGPCVSMDVATLFPQLKDVHITHCSINRWDIPWASLTTARLCHDATYEYPGLFDADDVRDSTIYEFDYYLLLSGLVQAVNLHTLHLDLVLPVDTFDYLGLEPVSMPNLRSLSLSASQAYKLSLFFTYVGCPILEELSLSIQDQDPSEWDDTIHSQWTEFLQRCAGSLRVLTMDDGWCLSDDHFIGTLYALPTLTELYLGWNSLSHSIFDALTLKYESDPNEGSKIEVCCPMLTTLEIWRPVVRRGDDSYEGLYTDFVDMIQSRRHMPDRAVDEEGRAVPLLKVLKMNHDDMMCMRKSEPSQYARLKKLESEGMVFETW